MTADSRRSTLSKPEKRMASKIDRTVLNRKLKEEANVTKQVSSALADLHTLRAEIADCYHSAFEKITKSLDEEFEVLSSALEGVYLKKKGA